MASNRGSVSRSQFFVDVEQPPSDQMPAFFSSFDGPADLGARAMDILRAELGDPAAPYTYLTMAVASTRHVRIRFAGDNTEMTVPEDVAALLGPEAELEVGSGQVTIRRSGKLTREALSAIAKPPKTAQELLRHATRPLTDSERAALSEFLDG